MVLICVPTFCRILRYNKNSSRPSTLQPDTPVCERHLAVRLAANAVTACPLCLRQRVTLTRCSASLLSPYRRRQSFFAYETIESSLRCHCHNAALASRPISVLIRRHAAVHDTCCRLLVQSLVELRLQDCDGADQSSLTQQCGVA